MRLSQQGEEMERGGHREEKLRYCSAVYYCIKLI